MKSVYGYTKEQLVICGQRAAKATNKTRVPCPVCKRRMTPGALALHKRICK